MKGKRKRNRKGNKQVFGIVSQHSLHSGIVSQGQNHDGIVSQGQIKIKHYRMAHFRIICILVLFSVMSCYHKEKESSENYENAVEIIEHTTKDYAYCMPKKHTNKLPLFVVIDAHGNSKVIINKFRPALREYQFIVIGLSNISNNTPEYEVLIKQATDHAIKNLPVDTEHIFYAGFSGGARMAFQYAITNNNSRGVIMCGAGPQNKMLEKINFPLIAVSGLKDFNFIEQYYPPRSPLVQNPDFISLYFEGKHEWPPGEIINECISFLLLKSDLQKNINKNVVKSIISKKDSLLRAKQYLLAFKVLEKAYKTCNDNNKDAFLSELNKMARKDEIKAFFLSLNQVLKEEMERNHYYYKCLFSKDINWWYREIAKIDDKLNNSGNSLVASSYSRTRGFLGVLLYSTTNTVIKNQNNNNLTEKLLTIYEHLEPENPDVDYFKSLFIKK